MLIDLDFCCADTDIHTKFQHEKQFIIIYFGRELSVADLYIMDIILAFYLSVFIISILIQIIQQIYTIIAEHKQ